MGDDTLPVVNYPPMIKGSLRLILQLKDAFLGSFNLVEEYRDQLLSCKRGFTRDLVCYQLTKGLASIIRLRDDLTYVESQAHGLLKRNIALRKYILDRYSMGSSPETKRTAAGIVSRIGPDPEGDPNRPGTGTAVVGNAIPPPVKAPDSIEHALHGGLDHFKGEVDVDDLNVPLEVDLANTTTDNGTHLLPVVEFYRNLYFLQMHFQLIMCQAANYALPVATRQMSFSERAFSWPTMPAFGMASTQGSMKDRLMELHTEVQDLATRIHECLGLVRIKMAQDRRIEVYFLHHSATQEALQRTLLRGLQAHRVYAENLEGQNDRLAGLAIKMDPAFAKTTDFTIMTGPGVAFQDDSRQVTSNQNSAAPSPVMWSTRRDSNNDRDQGGAGLGGRSSFNRPVEDSQNRQMPSHKSRDSGSTSRKSESQQPPPRAQSNVDSRRISSEHFSGPDESIEYGNEFEVPAEDTNISASGGGRAAIWLRKNKRDMRHSGPTGPPRSVQVDVELSRKLDSLRGCSQAVDELLLGVDAIANGSPGGKMLLDGENNLPTPSFLNTENYVTSIYDDVIGHTTYGTKPSGSQKPPVQRNGPKSTSVRSTIISRTPSTRFSQADSITPMLSVEPHATIVTELTSRRSTMSRGEELSHMPQPPMHNTPGRDSSSEVTRDGTGTDDTVSSMSQTGRHAITENHSHSHTHDGRDSPRQWNTNVNASHTQMFPQIVPQPRISRNPRSVSASTGARHDGVDRPDNRAECYRCQGEVEPINIQNKRVKTVKRDAFTEQHLQSINQQTTHCPVQTVGAAECGSLCAPDWIASRRANKPEDLLAEPKRSEFNRAIQQHRCRLVETILQADEERLEEIISLLLRE